MLEDVPDGGLIGIDDAVPGDGTQALILYRAGSRVKAWCNVCPHAGRRLDWAPGQFLRSRDGGLVCAVHGATFDPASGECTAGPCRGQALLAVAVEVREGGVWRVGDVDQPAEPVST
jgi:nitrite reductase/ring-hydroxylating ferredoxin subunit